MGRLQRLSANLFNDWFQLRRRFPAPVLDDIATAIAEGELTHKGEVRLALESRLGPWPVLHGLDAPTRARHVFVDLRVWDTEHNNGVLIYVLMAERRIEVVADRGIAQRVQPDEWKTMCARMQEHFAQGAWREGALRGIADAHALLQLHFPADGQSRLDELPDRPVLL
ncbi:TPM domain-containing protein [Dyella sp. A6]|uniref:TPM domain-containing protein n=1 Tax=Dyella aluminiiresistens TaxID=3069105 RepID=UPI002E761E2E|nr:TPM domain-containing protein [Dyella sp. A6]